MKLNGNKSQVNFNLSPIIHFPFSSAFIFWAFRYFRYFKNKKFSIHEYIKKYFKGVLLCSYNMQITDNSLIRLSGLLSLKWLELRLSLLGPELRLGGSLVPHAGRVELRFKGIWGTISQHNSVPFWPWFPPHTPLLGPRPTRVICRQLGFTDAVISIGYSGYGPGVGPEWLDAYHLSGCLGHERSILNCSYSSPRFIVRYNHQEDASVVCKPNTSYTSGKQKKHMHRSISNVPNPPPREERIGIKQQQFGSYPSANGGTTYISKGWTRVSVSSEKSSLSKSFTLASAILKTIC